MHLTDFEVLDGELRVDGEESAAGSIRLEMSSNRVPDFLSHMLLGAGKWEGI
jgi:hypothetical protein